MLPPIDNIASRVAARYREAKSLGNLNELLHRFELGVLLLKVPDQEITKSKKVLNEYLESEAKGPHTWERQWPGFIEAYDIAFRAFSKATHGVQQLAELANKLFLAILQELVLPPALRRKVEQASRVYATVGKPRLKQRGVQRDLEYFDVYEKRMSALSEHLDVAKEAIKVGKEHSGEGPEATKMKVGDFTLVNTGGFPESVMQTVSDLIQKAQSHLKSKGFGKVCYGDVQITNKLQNKTYAFYYIEADELFIRADAKASPDALKTVLHELGHRYQYQFMKGREQDLRHLYYVIENQESGKGLFADKDQLPAIGDTVVDKKKTFRVTQILPSRKGWEIRIVADAAPERIYKVDLEGWLTMKGEKARDLSKPDFKGFVTPYAKKGGPGENFAEMFAFYCLDKLPSALKEPFEELIGRVKTAGGYDTDLFDNAVKDLNKLRAIHLKVNKKAPTDKDLQDAVTAVSKMKGLMKWVFTCFEDSTGEEADNAWDLVKGEKTLDRLNDFATTIITLPEVAPAHFEYSGFKVTNEQRISDTKCRKLLGCVDYLLAVFKKRGVSELLLEGIRTINLVPTNIIESRFGGLYDPETRELTLTTVEGDPRRVFIEWFNHIFLHEFGHYVHVYYLSSNAKAVWDEPWDEGEDPESVSNYGGSNKFEDFAETFVAFVAAPEKLTSTAKFRMQRTLSVSGLYGKPVMKLAASGELAGRVAFKWLLLGGLPQR